MSRILNEKLIADIGAYLTDPPPADLPGGVHMIIELAVNIASHLPMESREVFIFYWPPLSYFSADDMSVETGIPPLTAAMSPLNESPSDSGADYVLVQDEPGAAAGRTRSGRRAVGRKGRCRAARRGRGMLASIMTGDRGGKPGGSSAGAAAPAASLRPRRRRRRQRQAAERLWARDADGRPAAAAAGARRPAAAAAAKGGAGAAGHWAWRRDPQSQRAGQGAGVHDHDLGSLSVLDCHGVWMLQRHNLHDAFRAVIRLMEERAACTSDFRISFCRFAKTTRFCTFDGARGDL